MNSVFAKTYFWTHRDLEDPAYKLQEDMTPTVKDAFQYSDVILLVTDHLVLTRGKIYLKRRNTQLVTCLFSPLQPR